MARLQIVVLVVIAEVISAFHFKTNDPKHNLDIFVRTIGSTDQNVSSVNYLNGSVYGKQPGNPLQKLFNFEGYNINRKIPQSDGSYLSLSREIVVYRDPNTTLILQVWMNPWTSKANEVFTVANDPVNAMLSLGDEIPTRQVGRTMINFNTDVILEYPNVLRPGKYSKYSAGPVYDAVELFGFFSNLTTLSNSQTPSVPATSTWIRKSEYLPWMEMSTSPGGLYYTTMAWKCNKGLSCVADDIMELVKNKYPKYLTAPTTDDEPNETSWSVFKKTIDSRRKAGKPDIVIPEVNATSGLVEHTPYVDERVLSILNYSRHGVTINGTAWSEIRGKQPYTLFDVRGGVQVDFKPHSKGDGYRLQLEGYINYINSTTGIPMTFFNNPITGKTNIVHHDGQVIDLIVDVDDMYSMDIPDSQAVGVVMAFSPDHPGSNSGQSRNWSVTFADLIFNYADLARVNGTGGYYGTVGSFMNWPSWMEMGDIGGNLVVKATVSKYGLF